MKKLNFPEISKKIQKNTFGGYTVDMGYLDEVDLGDVGGGDYDWGDTFGDLGDTFGDGNGNDGYGDSYGGGSGSGDQEGGADPVTLSNVGDMQSQIGNMCTMEAIRFISAFVGDNASLNAITTWIAQNVSVTAIMNGMTPAQLVTTMNHFFDNVTELTTDAQIQNSIDNGNMVMSTFINGNDGHAVVITGYDSDTGQYQYSDPQDGTEGNWGDVGNFDLSWEINGAAVQGGGSAGGGDYDRGNYDYDYDY